MIPSLPRWIWSWATLLPAVAGSVNAIALLSLRHGGVTHVTGISTEAAIGAGTGQWNLLLHAVAVVALFTAGCAVSAFIARGPRWRASTQAAALLSGVAALLVVAALVMNSSPAEGIMLCALAMGLQNGTTSLVSGAVLRTSHLTGMFTDLGIAVGQRAWRGPVDRRRVAVCLTVAVSFMAGAVGGTWLYGTSGPSALLVSACVAGVVAALTLLFRARTTVVDVPVHGAS